MAKEQTAAVLTIYKAPKMSPQGRKDIAEWLRRQAKALIKDGKLYTPTRFTARYIYTNKKK